MRAIKDETIFYGLLYVPERGEGNIFTIHFLPVIYHLRRIFNEFYVPHITTYFLV